MQDGYELLGISSSASVDEIKAALEQHREMYSMVVNSPDRELAARAQIMLKKLDEAEKKFLAIEQTKNAGAEGDVSYVSGTTGWLQQEISRCVWFFRLGQATEAHELLNRLEAIASIRFGKCNIPFAGRRFAASRWQPILFDE